MATSLFQFAPSLDWETRSDMEIVKQGISQRNLFEQHDHTTNLSILSILILNQSHRT